MINRRQFIKGATSAATLGSLALPIARARAHGASKLRIGATPSSWGVWFASDPLQPPWQRFLDEVEEAGYKEIELGPFGYLPTQSRALRVELEKRNLQVCAGSARAHLGAESSQPWLEEQVRKCGQLLSELGAKYLVLFDDTCDGFFTGRPAEPARPDVEIWNRLIETVQRMGDLARNEFGLQVVFHPYAYSQVETTEQIEALLKQTDASRVSLCLDTGHLAFRGGDPVAFVRRHHNRIAYLHLQNVNAAALENWFKVGNGLFLNAVEMGVFSEPYKGVVNFAALHDALTEVGFEGWAIVEQEMYPTAYDLPLPIAKRSFDYFRGIGFA